MDHYHYPYNCIRRINIKAWRQRINFNIWTKYHYFSHSPVRSISLISLPIIHQKGRNSHLLTSSTHLDDRDRKLLKKQGRAITQRKAIWFRWSMKCLIWRSNVSIFNGNLLKNNQKRPKNVKSTIKCL